MSDGSRYHGDFERNLKTGTGTLIYPDSGNKYEGEWKDDNYHGSGIVTYANGDELMGTWDNGIENGVFFCTSGGIREKKDFKNGICTKKTRLS
jgi:hypothetical protein